ALLAVLGHYYYHLVWLHPAPTMSVAWRGETFELLHPRMLGTVLLAPWFLAVLAWTLADLPWQQKALTVLLRVGFVALLVWGLARPGRRATSDKSAAVYLVDVSESVSDEALGDAQKLIDEGYATKRPDDVVKVVTFAVRPRLLEGEPRDDGADEP